MPDRPNTGWEDNLQVEIRSLTSGTDNEDVCRHHPSTSYLNELRNKRMGDMELFIISLYILW